MTVCPGCKLVSTMVCVSKGMFSVRVSVSCLTRWTRRIVVPLSFSTLTRSSLPSVMPLESRIEAAVSLPLGAMEVFPSAMTVTGPFSLMTKPPVSWLYTFLISTVTLDAATSLASKNPSSWSMLVATVQNGTSVPSMLIVVSYAERTVTTSWSLSSPLTVDSTMSCDLTVTCCSCSSRWTVDA